MDVRFGNLSSLWLLWVAAAVVAVVLGSALARRRALAQFATPNLRLRLTDGISDFKRVIKFVLLTVALGALVGALLDPRWGRRERDVPDSGLDVMIVLDVSRSMLADDASPSRLERAKQQIVDLLDALEGERVGLVLFAGSAQHRVPLTSNYADFRQSLDEVAAQSVQHGGSRLGAAIETAVDGFLPASSRRRAVIIWTDGEDPDSQPLDDSLALAKEHDVHIFTVGIGDSAEGARIPIVRTAGGTRYLQHEGQHVWTKMNDQLLAEVAKNAAGIFIPAGIKRVDMDEVYRSCLVPLRQPAVQTAHIRDYVPRYQWFLAAALALVLSDTFLTTRVRQPVAAQ